MGRSELAEATVYQKHRSLLSRKTTYRADACPVPEGYVELLGLRFKAAKLSPVNGGRNYQLTEVVVNLAICWNIRASALRVPSQVGGTVKNVTGADNQQEKAIHRGHTGLAR